jgi:hypothetical protein
MALACELTSVRGDRGENYENTKKHIKKKKIFFTYLINTNSKTTFIVLINSLLNNFFYSSFVCTDDWEVSSSALVEVRFCGRSSDFYGTYPFE